MLSRDKLRRLKALIKVHADWLVSKLLGPDVLSPQDTSDLQAYGKLPVVDSIELPQRSYALGKLKALSTSKEYSEVGYPPPHAPFVSHTDELAVQEARLRGATLVKRLTDDIEAGVFSKLNQAMGGLLTEAAIKDIIADQVAIALLERKGYQALATSLVKELRTGWKRDWKRLAATELHRAKTRGMAMAIITRQGLYAGSKGVDSSVCVVPSRDACEDCIAQYTDRSGNPKVFTLKELLENGSNGDPGVSHKRGSKGIHSGWKPTLPGLHPGCWCRLQYLPEGMGWQDGKLVVQDPAKYREAVSKAISTAATKTAPPKPASIPGVSAPGNSPGPGRPSKGGVSKEWEYYKGDGSPPPGGGWEQSESGAWRREVGSGAGGKAAEESADERHQKIEDAKIWSSIAHDHSVVLNHLKEGEIVDDYRLDGKEGGVNESHRIVIGGNGRGLLKPTQKLETEWYATGAFYTEGCGTVPYQTSHKREQAAYKLFSALGSRMCPPTTGREYNGEPSSVQHWVEGSRQCNEYMVSLIKKGCNAKRMLDAAGPAKEALKEQMFEMVTMDIVMNSNDRHYGNMLVNEDFSELTAIDHGVSFGNGMAGYKNTLHRDLNSGNYHVKIPEKLHERMKNTTYGDVKRACEDHLEDWEMGQTFLRMQYALHLQETHGHLPFDHFRSVQVRGTHYTKDPVFSGVFEGSPEQVKAQVEERWKKRELSHQRFEDFAIDFLDSAAADPSHPHHESAKEILDVGVFMGEGFAHHAAQYRSDGRHESYEHKIREERAKIRAGGTVDLPDDDGNVNVIRPVPQGENNPRANIARVLAKMQGKQRGGDVKDNPPPSEDKTEAVVRREEPGSKTNPLPDLAEQQAKLRGSASTEEAGKGTIPISNARKIEQAKLLASHKAKSGSATSSSSPTAKK